MSNRIKAIIDNHGIKNYESEFRIDYFDESLNCHRFRRYDFKFGNVLLELNGDYFHANPLKYKAKDVLNEKGTLYILPYDSWCYTNVYFRIYKDK